MKNLNQVSDIYQKKQLSKIDKFVILHQKVLSYLSSMALSKFSASLSKTWISLPDSFLFWLLTFGMNLNWSWPNWTRSALASVSLWHPGPKHSLLSLFLVLNCDSSFAKSNVSLLSLFPWHCGPKHLLFPPHCLPMHLTSRFRLSLASLALN